MYFIAPPFWELSPVRQTGSDEIDSPPKDLSQGGIRPIADDRAVRARSSAVTLRPAANDASGRSSRISSSSVDGGRITAYTAAACLVESISWRA
jgi:hypothetical protein